MAEVRKVGCDIGITASVERYEIVDSATTPGPAASAVSRGLDVLKARVSLVKGGQHVEYQLRVTHEDGKIWLLRKRFNEVSALHDILKKRLTCVPEIPAKSVVRQFSPEYLEARKLALGHYLREICKRRDVMNCPEAQEFFALAENVPNFRQNGGLEPMQVAEVRESTFGITAFDFDPVQGLLLLGARESSWASRLDTKITNIKLPWEPAAPNLPTSQMSLWRQVGADLRFEMQFACRYVASVSCVVLSVGREGGVCLCGLGDGTVGCTPVKGETGVNVRGSTLPLLRHTAGVVALATDEGEQWLISASKDKAIMVYDTKRQMILCEVQTPAPTSTMTYCSVQRRLMTGLTNGQIVLWDTSILPIQQLVSIPEASAGPLDNVPISAMDYDTSNSTLFSAARDGFTLWTVKSSSAGSWGRKVGQIVAPGSSPTAVAWAASSREILAGFASGAVVVFDVDKGEPTFALQAHKEEVTTLLWLDAPRRLITGSKDKTVKMWDFPSLRRAKLEDQQSFEDVAAGGPTVSVAPHLGQTARGRSGSGSATSFSAGAAIPGFRGDPLSGASSDSRGVFEPTARPPTSSERSAATAAAPAAPPFPVPASSGPRVLGAPAGSMVKGDSDDDLAGWDR